MTDVRVHSEAVEILGDGTPSALVHGEAVEILGSIPADVRVHGVAVEFLGVYIGPPDVPENVSGTPYVFSADLTWDPPSAGYPVAYYEVRVDAGPWVFVGLSTFYRFTGLTSGSDHTLEVRAVNNGGASAAVADVVHTFEAGDTPPGYYRVEVTLGAHSWTGSNADEAPEFGIALPVTLGWSIPDEVDYFPAMADPTMLQFRIFVDDVAGLADVVKGTTCTFRMFVQVDEEAEPWQTFDGVVRQLTAERVNFEDGRTLVTVFAGDDNLRLADIPVGYTAIWPQESVYDRVNRICAEAGVAPEWFFLGTGSEGTLAARAIGVTNALSALRDTLKDVANDNQSEYPNEYWGRLVFRYSYAGNAYMDPNTIRFMPFERRVYSGQTATLDGGLVEADGRWSKLPSRVAATWGIIDGATFGTPDGTPPFVRNTSFVDTLPGFNPSAVSRDALGESLVPDGSTNLAGWYARELLYRMLGNKGDDHLADVLAVTEWASYAPPVVVQPVVLADVAPRYRLNGETYLAGTLTGARLTIPAGGRFYMTLRLRPELLPGTELP